MLPVPFVASLALWGCGKALGIAFDPNKANKNPFDAFTEGPLKKVSTDLFVGIVDSVRKQFDAPAAALREDPLTKVSCEALRSTIRWLLADQTATRSVDETLTQVQNYSKTAKDYDAFVIKALAPPEPMQWYRNFIKALQGETFETWHAQLLITETQLRTSFKFDHCDLNDFLTDKLLEFAEQHSPGQVPSNFKDLITASHKDPKNQQRPRPSLRLADAYGLFWRSLISKQPEALAIFTIETSEALWLQATDLAQQLIHAVTGSQASFAGLQQRLEDGFQKLGAGQAGTDRSLSDLRALLLLLGERIEQDDVHAQQRYTSLLAELVTLRGDLHRLAAQLPTLVDYSPVRNALPANGFRRRWFEQQFEAWLAASTAEQQPPYLVLEAGPFFGKTWVADWVIRHRQANHQPTAYHFFRRSGFGLTSLEDAYRSLGKQLIDLHALTEARQPDNLRDFLTLIGQIPKTASGATVIVIDGLDEAFGPLSARPNVPLDDFLPNPSIVQNSAVRFFMTTRPEFLAYWNVDQRSIGKIVVPDTAALIEDVRQALPGLLELTQQQGRPTPPAALIPAFATASEGLLGLVWDFFLRATPEQFERWAAQPGAIPHGAAGAMLERWNQVMAAAKTPGAAYGPAEVRVVNLILALAREPLSLNQLQALFAFVDDSIRPRPHGIDFREIGRHLESILALNTASYHEPGSGERLYGFRHTSFADLLSKPIPGIEAPQLPDAKLRRQAQQWLAAACTKAGCDPEHELHRYALFYGPSHLVDANQLDKLLQLVNDDAFIAAADGISPQHPYLGVSALKLALVILHSKVREDDHASAVASMFTLAARHALHRQSVHQEDPFEAAVKHGYERALALLEDVRPGHKQALSGLIIALHFEQAGRNDLTTQLLMWLQHQHFSIPALRAHTFLSLLSKFGVSHQNTCALLANKVPRLESMEWLVADFAERSPTDQLERLSIYRNIANTINNADYRIKALVNVAKASGQVQDCDAARDAANLIKNSNSKDKALLCTTSAYCQARNYNTARNIAKSINNVDYQIEALVNVANASGQVQDCDAARDAANLVKNSNSKDKALLCITSAYCQARNYNTARNIAKSINLPEFRLEALLTIAKASGEAQDCDETLSAANTVEDSTSRAKTIQGVVYTYCNIQNYDAARGIARSIKLPEFQVEALLTIATCTGQAQDYDAALSIADCIEYVKYKARVLLHIAKATGRDRDYDAARSIADCIEYGEDKVQALLHIAKATGRDRDYDAARHVADALNPPGLQEAAIKAIVQTTGLAKDYNAARRLSDSLENPSSKTRVIFAIVRTYRDAHDYVTARRIADVIENPYYRTRALFDIAQATGESTDYEAANRAANSPKFSECKAQAMIAIATAGCSPEDGGSVGSTAKDIQDSIDQAKSLYAIAQTHAESLGGIEKTTQLLQYKCAIYDLLSAAADEPLRLLAILPTLWAWFPVDRAQLNWAKQQLLDRITLV